MVENELMRINKEEYKHYFEADREIYEWLMNRDNISQRNKYIRNIESQYPISPITGRFEHSNFYQEVLYAVFQIQLISIKHTQVILWMLSISLYLMCLMFGQSMIIMKQKMTQYKIECLDNIETLLLFGMNPARTYGYALNFCHIEDLQI